jgi:hypothetical protein
MLKKIINAFYFKILASMLNIKSYRELRNLVNWSKNSYKMPAPTEVKVKTLNRWGGKEVWIETGTYEGLTTIEISKFAKQVISLEASSKYFNLASISLSGYRNIDLVHGTSENCLDSIMSKLSKERKLSDISFWLDAHYSSGETYRGLKDSPVIEELKTIQSYLIEMKHFTICIDDVRLFRSDRSMPEDFPDLSEIMNWIESNGLFWTIEHDILVISNRVVHK